MRAATALLLCLLVLPAWGDETTVYKRMRPDGTIEFSDTPLPDGEAIHVPLAPAYQAPAVPAPVTTTPPAPPVAEPAYKGVAITNPAQDATVFFDEQGLPVSVDVQPALKRNHVVALYLDGQRVASGTAGSFLVKEVYRGTHSLVAVVEGADRKVLLRSPEVAFHLVQHIKNPIVPKKAK